MPGHAAGGIEANNSYPDDFLLETPDDPDQRDRNGMAQRCAALKVVGLIQNLPTNPRGECEVPAYGAITSTGQSRPGARAARASAVSKVVPSCSARAT